MKNTVFTGSGVALITPFNEKGVDFDKLGELIEFHIANNTDAIVVCGTTGEPATMPDAEHISVIEYTVKKAAGRIKVIAGTGSNDTRHCIEMVKKAESVGADALLLVTPYYNKTSQKGLEIHFTKVADAINIPAILYNVPSRTGLNISVECMKNLSKHKNIVGLKEASGNLNYMTKIFAECGDDIDIYSGEDGLIVPCLSLGGKGVISVLANVLPQETHDLCQKFFDGDVAGSAKMQLKYLDLINALFIEVNPIPVKAAMNLMGMNVGSLRLPLCEISDSANEVLKSTMKRYGLLK